MKAVVLAVLALVGLAFVDVAPARAAPPLAAFARLPAIEQAVISPDGARVALLGGPPGERIIFLAPVDGKDSVTVKLGQAWVREIHWAGSGFLVVNFSLMDRGTDYSNGRAWAYQLNRSIVLDASGKMVASLLSDAEWSRYAISQPILGVIDGAKPQAMVLGLDLSAEVFIDRGDTRIENRGNDLIAALWQVDVTNGKGRVVERGNRTTQMWELDIAGQPRLRRDYDGDLDELYFYGRPKGSGNWARIDTGKGADALQVLGYSDPEDSVYLLGEGPGGARLLRRSLATGVTTAVTLDRPLTDLDLAWDPYSIAPVAVVSAAERPAYQWLDGQLGVVHGKLARAFAGRNVQLTSWTKDRSIVVVRVSAPDSPPAWFLFDTRTNQASSLGESYPELASAPLGTTTWMTYKARDGLEIPAWLTLPPGLAPGVRPPLIVMPHGGPAARDHFDFDWWVQALATRGYAVLRPQFRGSAGFGAAFQKAGHGEWGGKMQDDLIDGVLALADRGVIDRKAVAIAGASYGGYAALFGATVYPNLYRCGVSVNGISDLALLIGSDSRAYGRDTVVVNALEVMMGDPRANAEAFRLGSPVFRVTGQTAPMLLIHGEEDTTVPIQQSRTMVRALKAAGRPVEFLPLADDDHHLSSTVSRQKMLETMFGFLDRCLPVGG